MLRIVERLFGHGTVVKSGVPVLSGGYAVSVYREWATAGGELIPGDFVIEGHLLAPAEQLEPLLGASHLVLRLDDGRWFDVHLVSLDGTIANVEGCPLHTTE